MPTCDLARVLVASILCWWVSAQWVSADGPVPVSSTGRTVYIGTDPGVVLEHHLQGEPYFDQVQAFGPPSLYTVLTYREGLLVVEGDVGAVRYRVVPGKFRGSVQIGSRMVYHTGEKWCVLALDSLENPIYLDDETLALSETRMEVASSLIVPGGPYDGAAWRYSSFCYTNGHVYVLATYWMGGLELGETERPLYTRVLELDLEKNKARVLATFDEDEPALALTAGDGVLFLLRAKTVEVFEEEEWTRYPLGFEIANYQVMRTTPEAWGVGVRQKRAFFVVDDFLHDAPNVSYYSFSKEEGTTLLHRSKQNFVGGVLHRDALYAYISANRGPNSILRLSLEGEATLYPVKRDFRFVAFCEGYLLAEGGGGVQRVELPLRQ